MAAIIKILLIGVCTLLVTVTYNFGDCSVIPEESQATAPTQDELNFLRDPVRFLEDNALSTWPLSNPRPPEPPLQNGERTNFGLLRTSDNTGFNLYNKGSNTQGIFAWWLQTGEKVTIPMREAPIYLITAELQGCSIYVRYNHNADEITVFHHRRSFSGSGPGNAAMYINETGAYVQNGNQVECYDDVLYFEEYFPGNAGGDILCPPEFGGVGVFGATPFLYHDILEDEWQFLYKGYCYRFAGEQTDLTPANTGIRRIQERHCN